MDLFFKTAEDILSEKGSSILSTHPDATIAEAITLITQHKVGAILAREDDKYVGIWTERDLINQVLTRGFDVKTSKLRDHMKTKLIYAQHDDDVFHLIDKFLGLRLRHLLIQRDGHCIGFLSAGDVMRAALQQRTEELERMRDIVTLEFYDEWRWKKKRKK